MSVNDDFCEFARTVQSFLDLGWRIVDLKYGERKFDLSTEIVAEKEGVRRNFSPDDIHCAVREAQTH